MKLNFEQIRAVTHGAARILQEERGIRFRRLHEDQFAVLAEENESIANTGAGIKLVFRTDSTTLSLRVFVEGELYWWPLVSFDIQVNGETVGHLDNFSHIADFVPKFEERLPLGQMEQVFDLGEGEKTVTVHLPWCQQFVLEQLSLDDGACIRPIEKEKLLMYGDSITQGYCATRPSRRVAARLAAELDMEECNRAMAGGAFLPPLAALADSITPRLITVAYGSNDWGRGYTPEKLGGNCRQFLQNLKQTYPGIPVAVISPLPRINFDCSNPVMDYETLTACIRTASEAVDGVTFIDGGTLLPKDPALLFDGLHPNDDGMALYAHNLARVLRALV